MTLELFVFPPSPRAFKVMVVANHLDLDWTLRPVNAPGGGTREPDYATMNPNMRMPTLKHGDYVLWESNTICQYLALLKPESGLLPRDEPGRLDVTRWQFWDLAHMDAAVAPFMFENLVKPRFFPDLARDEASLAKAAEHFHRSAAVLGGQLAKHRYVTGDTLTLADFSLGAALLYAEPAQIPWHGYSEIRRWHAELSALPAWQKTVAIAMAPVAATSVAATS